MEKGKKTHFISGKIRNLEKREEVRFWSLNLVLQGEEYVAAVATVPAFVSDDGKMRDLIFNQLILDKIVRDHGAFIPENFVINANDWDVAILNMRSFKNNILTAPNSDKINLIKMIPNSRNFLLIAAEKQNGYFVLTHFETVIESGNELKSLLGRGDLIGPTGTPLGPADFLVAPSPKAFLRGVSGSGDENTITKGGVEFN